MRQFQFHCWPEVGVPTPTVLIEFIREVQKLCRSLPSPHGPIVVHCRQVEDACWKSWLHVYAYVHVQQWCGKNWCVSKSSHHSGEDACGRIDRCIPDSKEPSHSTSSHGANTGEWFWCVHIPGLLQISPLFLFCRSSIISVMIVL